MNKLVVVFGLFGLTFFFGLGVTAVQFATDSFFFPFDSGSSLDVDDPFGSDEEDFVSPAVDMEEISPYYPAPEEAAVDYAEEAIVGGWTCGDGSTIDGSWTNDGECDCEDCSDESVFRCSTGEFIPNEYVNDGECDCTENCEDEG